MKYDQPPIHELKAAYLKAKAAYENAEALLAFMDSEEYAQAIRDAAEGDDPRLTNGKGFSA